LLLKNIDWQQLASLPQALADLMLAEKNWES
jgi:hypothetical protein